MTTAQPRHTGFATAVLAVFAACAVDALRSRAVAQDAAFPLYVGWRSCVTCHASAGPGRACTLEAIPEHEDAYDALSRSAARHIAAVSGVPQHPTESRICLGCHATAADEGPRWTTDTFDVADGVQCEACHGPGSLHVRAWRNTPHDAAEPPRRTTGPTGRSPRNPPRPHASSLNAGDRTACRNCHVDRPSHTLVLDDGYRRPHADRRYKTPVNLAVSPTGDVLYVVCEQSNTLAIVDPAARTVLTELAVGLRPHGVAVAPDGRTVYVTNRMANSVTVIDTAARRVTATVAVGAEPHGVAVARDGHRLFVLNTGDDAVSVVDLNTLTELKRLAAGRGPWALALHPTDPSLHITNVRPNPAPFREPHTSELTVVDTQRGIAIDRRNVADANMLMGIAYVPDPPVAIFTMMRTKNLVPITRLAQGWTITNGLGIAWPGGRVDQVLLDEPNRAFPDPTDVAVRPDGRYALVTSAGANELAVVDVAALLATVTTATDDARRDILPNHLGTSSRFITRRIAVGTNPRGVIFAPDGRHAYVACALDDTVTILDAREFRVVGRIDLHQAPPDPPRRTAGAPDPHAANAAPAAAPPVTEIRRGERLFRNADNAFGRQFSCSSCHPDGHINGLTFDIEADGIGMHPVDNRTLRGIFDTPPFKWEGTNPSLHRQCGPRLAVFFTRLDPFTPDELQALVRYESTIERPPNRHRRPDGLTPAQRRGKAVFERTHTNTGRPIPRMLRCATCHNTPYRNARALSDTRAAVGTTLWFDARADVVVEDLFDVDAYGELGIFVFADTGIADKAFDVPNLVNVCDTPPYLHNGAAETLEEIWTRFNMLDRHGYTADLTRPQFNDLIAYLKAL